MEIKRFVGGTLEANGYVVYNKQGGYGLIIDPGYNPKNYLDFFKEKDLKLLGILLTHLHHDHVGASDRLAKALNCKVYMHTLDAYDYRGQVDVYLNHGDLIDLEGDSWQVLHTPGHTRGGICLYSDKYKVAFSGDTIFDTDLGRSDLPGGSEKEMGESIRGVIDKWSNEVVIYPGHDAKATMKFVRQYNKEFLALRDGYER